MDMNDEYEDELDDPLDGTQQVHTVSNSIHTEEFWQSMKNKMKRKSK